MALLIRTRQQEQVSEVRGKHGLLTRGAVDFVAALIEELGVAGSAVVGATLGLGVGQAAGALARVL